MTIARLGLGFDYQYANRYPRGLVGLFSSLHERLSHLSIVALDTAANAATIRAAARDLPIIHHLSNVSPGDPDGPHLERLRSLNDVSRALAAVWSGEDIGIWSLGPFGIPYFAPSPFTDDVAQMVGERIRTVMAVGTVPFLAEIPSCSFTVGSMTLGEFFHKLVSISGCGIVLDLSHVLSYALSTGRTPEEVMDSLPLHAAVEVHIAGGRVNKTHSFRYIDSHSDPILDEVFALLRRAVSRCPGLRAVTYEIGVRLTEEQILHDFARVEGVLAETGFQPRLDARFEREARS